MATRKWEGIAATSPTEAKKWWSYGNQSHGPNMALLMGPGRLIALDVDGPAGRARLAEAETILGKLPDTLENITGRLEGGRHKLFTMPADATADEVKALTKSVAGLRIDGKRLVVDTSSPGLDLRAGDADAGRSYILVAPSIHPSGTPYEWRGGPIAELPRVWFDALPREALAKPRKATIPRGNDLVVDGPDATPGEMVEHLPLPPDQRLSAWFKKVLAGEVSRLRGAADGTRNDTLNSATLRVWRVAQAAGVPRSQVEATMVEAGTTAGLLEGEVALTVASAMRRGDADGPAVIPDRPKPNRQTAGQRGRGGVTAQERTVDIAELVKPPTRLPARSFPLTDYGNAERLVYAHGNDLRWCPSWGAWLVWDGQRWARDETGEVVRRAKATVRAIGNEDNEDWTELVKHALESEKAKSLTAMVNLATTEPRIPVMASDLDADPWLLNCMNGTLDLRTGQLLPHRREDHCTKVVPVHYDPDARSETWEAFLSAALSDDAEVIDYVKRAVGYSLTGDTREEVLFFVYGPGGSGKSTFLEAVRGVLGEYATNARFETFIKKSGDAPSATPEIARLRGARFVSSIETDDGKRLSEGTIKSLTGGDAVTARELYQRSFEFKPQFKIWLAANDAPKVNDTDDALFRRVRRVTFPNARTGEGERDVTIKARLTDVEQSGAAVLAWAVQGCLAWQRDGLKTPSAVAASTDAYRAENDPLAEFFAERVVFDPHATVARRELRAAYESWVRDYGSGFALSAKKFASRLRARIAAEPGVKIDPECGVRRGTSVVDGWRGVRLVDGSDRAEDREPADLERERFET